jgi:anthranilate phosphoribosyltransferase
MTTASPTASAASTLARLLAEDTGPIERERMFLELVALPLSTELLVACAKALRKRMVAVDLPGDPMDTCGTGGSGQVTINTSTLTALIVAAAGGKVAKHGNRSASGNCGCFDLLEVLGIRTDLTPEEERMIYGELGIVFLFAPKHHPAMRFVAPLRKQYGKKTIFNIVGPLANPARVHRQLIGTGNPTEAAMIAEALRALGTVSSMVVTGDDGLDEITVTGTTTLRLVTPEKISASTFDPAELGLSQRTAKDIAGGSPGENAAIFQGLLHGKGMEAHRELVLVNAAHALLIAGRGKTLRETFAMARETLASGMALRLFERYRALVPLR